MSLHLSKLPNEYFAYVDYQDTDAGGVVYHSKYIDFAERARGHFFRSLFGKVNLANEYMWVVKSLSVEYKAPARLEDLLLIKSNIVEIQHCSVIFKQDFFVNDILKVSMVIKLVSITKDFSFIKIEDSVKNKLNQFKLGDNN
ncbi:YbgC/FadM family acyl-CoA thioesterase [Rickettsiales bacterium LUAb2]